MLALQSLVDARFNDTRSDPEAKAPVDPTLMPLDLTVVSMRKFAVVSQPTSEDIALRQAA